MAKVRLISGDVYDIPDLEYKRVDGIRQFDPLYPLKILHDDGSEMLINRAHVVCYWTEPEETVILPPVGKRPYKRKKKS